MDGICFKIRKKCDEFLADKIKMKFKSNDNSVCYGLGEILYENLDITLMDAGNPNVWTFLSTCFLPDYTRWRWKDSTNNREIWGATGGSPRNAISRIWFRTKVFLKYPKIVPIEEFYHAPLEDFLVQVFERKSNTYNPKITMYIIKNLLEKRNELDQYKIAWKDFYRAFLKYFRSLYYSNNLDQFTSKEIDLYIKFCMHHVLEKKDIFINKQ